MHFNGGHTFHLEHLSMNRMFTGIRNSIQQSPSSQTDRCSVSYDISRSSWNPKVHHRLTILRLWSTSRVSRVNAVHALTHYSFAIRLNTMPICVWVSQVVCLFSSDFLTNSVCISHLYDACYVSRPSSPLTSISRIIFAEQYKLQSSSLCNSPHPPS
jgi:hypothetical protein